MDGAAARGWKLWDLALVPVLTTTFTLALMLSAPVAAADPCPPTGLSCLTDGQEVTETIDEIGDQPADSIEQVEEFAGSTVDEITGSDDIPTGGGGADDGGGGEASTEAADSGREMEEAGSSSSEAKPREVHEQQRRSAISSPERPRDASPHGRDVDPPTSTSGPVRAGRSSPIERFGQAALAAAQRLAFPAVLGVLVFAFLTIQNRLDRKDPKLAAAPVDTEFLTFE